MNHLAHLFLSGDDEKTIIGNFLYDFLTLKDIRNLEMSLETGFDLHVKIDTFTDNHALIKSGTARLHEHFSKYAPVVVDIYYDHILYLNWPHFSDMKYDTFSHIVYDKIRKELNRVPSDIALRLERMITHDFLSSYTSKEGMEYVFYRLSERTRLKKDFSKAVTLLYEHLDDYQSEFKVFFPDLIAECQRS